MTTIRLLIATLAIAATAATTAVAQEFLDTAGRWKSLTLPSGASPSIAPRSMVALRGHVVIGREGRSVIVSRDSGETWTNTGGALPAGVQTVWALGFPDTIGAPQRILGVVQSGTGPSSTAQLIETTDGGTTWRAAGALPELDVLFRVPVDTMRLYGPPAIQFAANPSGSGRTGFISSAAGLLVSTDDGATWSRRGERVAIRAMTMHDAASGVAAFGEYRPGTTLSSTPGGIYWTNDGGATWTRSYAFSDGGFFQHITFRTFSATQFRAFVPERFQNYMDWRLLRSSDAGRTWGEHRGRQAMRPLYGVAFWRDTTDVHVVSDGAILQHAADGGELFYLLRDTAAGYWQTPLDLIPGYVTRAPIAATDGRYLYFTVPGNRAARWRMAAVEPIASVDRAADQAGVAVVPNPLGSSGGRLTLGRHGSEAREVVIVDLLGRRHAVIAPSEGAREVALPAGLPPGGYLVLVRSTTSVLARVPFVVR